MKHFHDIAAYEQREMRLAEEIVRSVVEALRKTGLRDKQLRDLTEEIASSVACAVDGSSHMPLGDDHLVPILGFAEGRSRDRLLLPENGGSGLHGYVFGITDEVFANDRA